MLRVQYEENPSEFRSGAIMFSLQKKFGVSPPFLTETRFLKENVHNAHEVFPQISSTGHAQLQRRSRPLRKRGVLQ